MWNATKALDVLGDPQLDKWNDMIEEESSIVSEIVQIIAPIPLQRRVQFMNASICTYYAIYCAQTPLKPWFWITLILEIGVVGDK